jgi:F-type H+-transporting ATPase subunit b
MAQKSAEPITSMEHIPASEHGRGFPPFAPETFASQLFWFALFFVTLYLLMSRIALPRVGAILDQRRQAVEGDLATAQRLKDESDAAIVSYEKALAEARGRAQTLANETRERAAAAAEAKRKDVDAKLNVRLAEAEKAIAAKRAAAMVNLRSIASEAAPAIVERLTGIVPRSQDVAAAVADVLEAEKSDA